MLSFEHYSIQTIKEYIKDELLIENYISYYGFPKEKIWWKYIN